MEDLKPIKRKKDVNEIEDNKEKEVSAFKLKVQKKISVKNSINIFLFNNNILLILEEEKEKDSKEEEMKLLYEIYDGDSFKKLFTFKHKYLCHKKIETICLNNEDNKNELVTPIKKDEINHLLIYSFEIENNEFNYKEIKLIKIDYIPILKYFNNNLFISINKNEKMIYVYKWEGNNCENIGIISNIDEKLNIDKIKPFIINKENFILTDNLSESSENKEEIIFPLFLYDMKDFKFIRKEIIVISNEKKK